MSNSFVPKNKIAIISIHDDYELDMQKVKKIIKSLNIVKKREWFDPHFYNCLPLVIGNSQGFSVNIPFEFDVFWNGGKDPEDVSFVFYNEEEVDEKYKVHISSHFGNGIFTINLPFIIKTPENVNIMTISPPNFPLPGLSPLSGVVETDNLAYTFSLNIKIDIPNVWIKVLPDSPVIGLLPIPRFFCDSFELIDGNKKLDKNKVKDQKDIAKEHAIVRDFLSKNFVEKNKKLDRTYFMGTDIRGNKFKNHQKPGDKNK